MECIRNEVGGRSVKQTTSRLLHRGNSDPAAAPRRAALSCLHDLYVSIGRRFLYQICGKCRSAIGASKWICCGLSPDRVTTGALACAPTAKCAFKGVVTV